MLSWKAAQLRSSALITFFATAFVIKILRVSHVLLLMWVWGAGLLGTSQAAHAQQLDTLQHSKWKLYWASEFNVPGDSSVIAAQWQFAYPWGRNLGGYEGQYYDGRQIVIDSAGILHLRAQRRSRPRPYPVGNGTRMLEYESGMIFSRYKQDSLLPDAAKGRTGFMHGLFEIRCRFPSTPDSFSSFWLFGHPDEVDVFEAGTPELITNNIILWKQWYWRPGPLDEPNEASQSFFYWKGPGRLSDAYHTLAVSWEPQALTYYFDGFPIRRETRLVPMGFPFDVIANLGMTTWAQAKTGAFDIDYIRVYRPVLPAPLLPLDHQAPTAGFMQMPRTLESVERGRSPEMQWQVNAPPARRPRLELRGNINPRANTHLALPAQRHWHTPWVGFNIGETPQHWVASPDSGRSSLSWTLYDLCGRPVRSGQQLPAATWQLAWPDLPPGAYALRLRMGSCQVRHTVFQLGKPEDVVFTPEWLTPAVAPAVD